MVEKVNQENQTTKENKSLQAEVSIEELAKKAREIGYDQIPSGTSDIERKIVILFERNPEKFFTASQIFGLLKERDAKYFSDKLWYLARKGILEKQKTRGFYKIHPNYKKD